MSYRVIVQTQANADIDQVLFYLVRNASLDVAVRWLSEIERAVDTLEAMPLRCPIAPESVHFEHEIRQLLVDPYRVLFTIVGREVHVLHVRHASRRAFEDDVMPRG